LTHFFENAHASANAINPVKTFSFSLFDYDEAVEGLKGEMEVIKSARFD
jgi:hypothetical protein